MAIELSTTTHGVVHAKAYWKVVQVNMNITTKSGQITFDCYHSSTEKDIAENVLTQKNYVIESDDYDKYFEASVVNVTGKNYLERAYVFAKEKKELVEGFTEDIDDDKSIFKDVDGKVVTEEQAKKSFFDGGINV